jgi:hypothetical protein
MAQTAALKAFLKRLALIFGENDDPEVQATRPWKTKAEIAEQERYSIEHNKKVMEQKPPEAA